MGYVMGLGACIRCSGIFSFNPHKVPTIRVDGEKEPLCRNCYERPAAIRRENGLPPPPLSGAYEPVDENEL